LEERIRRLEDRAELLDLVGGYFLATDDDDHAALAECFCKDAEFISSGFRGGAGRDGILAFLKEARSAMGQTVHTLHHAQLSFLSPDEARGIVTAHLELGLGEETVMGAVRYLDTYRREDGRWRIATREMKVVHIGPWRDLGSSLTTPLNVRWPGAPAQSSDFPRKA
jgi:uncharacterized protein (TIGR02246 family)